MDAGFDLSPIGVVRSSLADLAAAPKQGDEGAPEAWIVFEERVRPALHRLEPGDRVVVVTWLHRADREVLQVHPRDDESVPLHGVFATRSPDRPNPIGLHTATVTEVRDDGLRVEPLEAIDGTPVLDVKIALKSETG